LLRIGNKLPRPRDKKSAYEILGKLYSRRPEGGGASCPGSGRFQKDIMEVHFFTEFENSEAVTKGARKKVRSPAYDPPRRAAEKKRLGTCSKRFITGIALGGVLEKE